VMIIVHNRSWSAPLQTVRSVINCEPRPMLEKSVLVDDVSERVFLERLLESYVQKLKVL
ncbi:hypothetical protein DBR06_SOUSAS2810103, partial [Sousa chinensis]